MWVIRKIYKVVIHIRDRFFCFGVVVGQQGVFNGECGFEGQNG